MTRTQMYAIWNLAMEIQRQAILFGASEIGTEEHDIKGIALIQEKSNLYKYLMENLDDTERL